MRHKTAGRCMLIALYLLLGFAVLGDAQSGKRKQQEPRGFTGIPSIPAVSSPERRVALVIGNAAYQYTDRLKNAANDAHDMAKVLQTLQFQVLLTTDATLDAMGDAIFTFGERLKGGGIGLFYYAGHGMQVKGENYLIPIDANVAREDDIKRKSINARDILEKMDEAKSHLNLVFLDACRNNPFPRSVRAMSRGLAGMNAPTGTLLVFATNPDNVAQDGTGRNGVYTKHLLHYIAQPGLEVGMMLRKIRTAVKEETGGQQVPWENGSIEGEFYFTGQRDGLSPVPPQPTLPTPAPQVTIAPPSPQVASTSQPTSSKAEAAFQRGVAALKGGTNDQAITAFTETLALTPNRVEAYHNRGEAYRLKGNYDQTLANYTQALVLNPNYAKAYYARGIVHSNQGVYNEALADYTQALTLNPSLAEAYVNRGIAYERGKRDYDRAIADYNQALVPPM